MRVLPFLRPRPASRSPLTALGLLVSALAAGGVTAQDWPNWRGPLWNGSAPQQPRELVDAFDAEGEGVRWVVDLPGPSAATPIVFGDHVFLTAADEERDRLVALCLDRRTGAVVWSKDADSGYRTADQGTRTRSAWGRSTYASPSPSCDGERVVFFFGNGDLVAFDLAGEELWRRNLQEESGEFAFQWTFSASPTLVDGRVFLPVLQRDTTIARGRFGGGRRGTRRRRRPARERRGRCARVRRGRLRRGAAGPSTGSSTDRLLHPLPRRSDRRDDLAHGPPEPRARREPRELHDPRALASARRLARTGARRGDVLTGHAAADGEELWRWGTWNEGHRERAWRLVPTVVIAPAAVLGSAEDATSDENETGGEASDAEGIALVCAPKRAPVYAVRLGGDGELPDDALLWQSDGRPNPVSSDVPTPAYHDGSFFVLSDVRSALSRVRANDGEVLWTTSIPIAGDDLLRASPVVADGRVWFMSHASRVFVVDAGSGAILRDVRLSEDDEHARSGLAVAYGDVFVRTERRLFCLGETD
jgi:outer membrane protein assembly factor BamB